MYRKYVPVFFYYSDGQVTEFDVRRDTEFYSRCPWVLEKKSLCYICCLILYFPKVLVLNLTFCYFLLFLCLSLSHVCVRNMQYYETTLCIIMEQYALSYGQIVFAFFFFCGQKTLSHGMWQIINFMWYMLPWNFFPKNVFAELNWGLFCSLISVTILCFRT